MFKIFSYLVVECDTLPGNYYNTIISAPNGTYFGSKAEISCPIGYRLEGTQVITCLSTGQWSSALPRCIKVEPLTTLPPPPPPPPSPTPTIPSTTSYRPKIIATTKKMYKPSTSSTTSSTTTPHVEINGESKLCYLYKK